MKKLESLENFKENKLSETHLSNVFGGVATAGGCRNVPEAYSASGCATFTSDDIDGNSESYSGDSDVIDCDELGSGGASATTEASVGLRVANF